MRAEKFYQRPKDCPNKFTVIKWYLSQDDIFGTWKDEKRDFFYDVLHQNKRGCFFSESCDLKAKDFIQKNPSLKEKAWFMGTFGSGGFFFLESGNIKLKKSTDTGIFFSDFKLNQEFLCRNLIIAPFETFEKRKNFLPLSIEKYNILKFMEQENLEIARIQKEKKRRKRLDKEYAAFLARRSNALA